MNAKTANRIGELSATSLALLAIGLSITVTFATFTGAVWISIKTLHLIGAL